jgi:hypothetical protein
MKKTICLLMMFLTYQTHAQLRVENIQTDKDALDFIQRVGEQNRMKWPKISFKEKGMILAKYYKKEYADFIDSITKEKWVVADFNSDGKKDLVAAFGSYSNHELFAFMSTTDTAYSLIFLGNVYSNLFPSGVSLIHYNDQLLLRLSIHQPGGTGEDVRKFYRSDTLVYKFSSFVEWKSSYENLVEFDSIVFEVSQVWNMGRSIPVTKLYKDGTIKLYQDVFVDTLFQQKWENGIKTCLLDKANVRKIETILAIIDYLKLKSKYDVPSVSDQTSYTTGVYIGGVKKVVFDYGGLNTYGLRLFYKEMSKLKLLCKDE